MPKKKTREQAQHEQTLKLFEGDLGLLEEQRRKIQNVRQKLRKMRTYSEDAFQGWETSLSEAQRHIDRTVERILWDRHEYLRGQAEKDADKVARTSGHD